jgi:hypothetical protein
MVLTDEEGANPPKQVEIFFNSVQANDNETTLTVFTATTLSVIPRIGEHVFLGKLGSFDVAGVRHEYVDRGGTDNPLLGRITVLLRKRQRVTP